MSLISFRNFLAPLGSKVQIGALLVLAFLAFVIRYQSTGGGSDASRESAQPRRVVSREESDLLSAMDQGSIFGGPKRKPGSDQDQVLEDALAGKGANGQPAAQQPQSERRTGGSSLDEIRRTMGLE